MRRHFPPLNRRFNFRNTMKHNKLKYAVAYTDGDDSFLIINEVKGRHPISFFSLEEGAAISWVNALGQKESVGLDFPLEQELITLATTKELYVMEMNNKNQLCKSFTITPPDLRLI